MSSVSSARKRCRQHYQPIQYGNQTLEEANDNLVRQNENDRIKSEFCKDNGIKLLWIPLNYSYYILLFNKNSHRCLTPTGFY